jgi:AraC-like DNA-binding protein
MLNDLFLISSTTLILSCLFTAIMLWIFARSSKPKTAMAISFSILTLFNAIFFIQTYQSSCEKVEKLDFIYGIFCIWLVYSIYIYFKTLMQPQKPNKPMISSLIITLVLYMLLYVLFSLIFEPVYIYSLKDISINISNPMLWLRIVLFLHYIVLFIFAMVSALKMYREHKQTIASQFSYQEKISLSWLPYILILFIFNGIATIFDIFLSGYALELYIFSNFAYAIFYLICGFLIVNQQDIIYNDISPECEDIQEGEKEAQLQNIPLNVRIQLKNKLLQLMEEEKIYLNPELRLDNVARTLHTNRTYLSIVIKEDFDDSFIGFVNRYRIEEAKSLIVDMANKSSLYEIAEQVGFKSLSSFNTFFKRHTNQTPALFRKSYFEQIKDSNL